MNARRWLVAVAAVGVLAGVVAPLAAAQDPPGAAGGGACPAGAVPEAPFGDRAGIHGPAVDCLHWYGFVHGQSDTSFGIVQNMTRGQLASLLHRILGALDLDLPTGGGVPFHDLVGSVHGDAVLALATLDPPVATGYGDGTFRPDAPVTRAELASFLARLHLILGFLVDGFDPLPAAGPSFPDVLGGAHREAIERLAGAGILSGFADGTFGPDAPASRGHMVLLVSRWLEHLVEAALLTPPGTPPEPPEEPAAPPAGPGAPGGGGGPTTTVPLPEPDALVGAGSRSVLPLVDGSLDYLDPAALPGPDDATSVGVFVEAFDDGEIDVGNGEADALWVRDDLRATAVAVEDLGSGDIVVLVSADLYMLFNADVRVIRERVLAALPAETAARTDVAVMTTHNHHGPDTAWNANHAWFEHMMDQVAAAAADAVLTRQPATLRAGAGEHWFGMGDTRDAQVIDPTMNVLQATALDGDVIATVVQWNNHPEVTLGWESPEDRSADCLAAGEPADCSTEDRYFTADYPGHLRRTITEQVGGEVVYLVGALGGLVAPLRVPLWEVDGPDGVGLGNQYDPPPGAVPAGGSDFATFTEANFRRAAVIGEQAALAALRFLEVGEEIDGPAEVDYRSLDVYTRLSNIGFRVLLVPTGDGHTALGHTPARLFTCPALGPKDASTCVDDGLATESDALAGDIRVGDHGRTEVAYLTLGPIGMVFMPGEAVSELAHGLPAGFDADPGAWFEASLDLHANGPAYDLPGYVRAQMDHDYEWTVGMGNDEIGYIVPLSDWRIACPVELDAVAGPGTCAGLAARGVLDHLDSASGAQCKAVVEGTSAPADPVDAFLLGAVCRYGQALGEATSHYEETMAAGWDAAADMMAAVRALTGGTSTERINPDFPGYWRGLPPPLAP